MQPTSGHTFANLLDEIGQVAKRSERVTIGFLADTLGHRSYGPFLIVAAVIEISPGGAIPGLPTFLAALILLFTVQIIAGREHLWMPAFVEKWSISVRNRQKAVSKSLTTSAVGGT